MTESEWLTSVEPLKMLDYLAYGGGDPFESDRGPRIKNYPSERSLCLFACSCCREVWYMLTPLQKSRLRLSEEVNLTRVSQGEQLSVESISEAASQLIPEQCTGFAVEALTFGDKMTAARQVVRWLHDLVPSKTMANILRDVVGNPYHPIFVVMTKVEDFALSHGHIAFEWLTTQVCTLAEVAQKERVVGCLDQVTLAALADALEEAGCLSDRKCPTCKGECVIRQEHPWGDTYAVETLTCHDCEGNGREPHPVIAHLRSPRPHWKNCHVIRSILNKGEQQ